MRIVTQNGENSIEFDGTEIFLQYEHMCYNLRRKTHRLACGMKADFPLTNI